MSTESADASFKALLNYLKSAHGFDFTGYKPDSLKRRIRKRMQTLNVDDLAEYLRRVESSPGEVAPLLDTILINVTSFFRDEDSWRYIAERVLPDILEKRAADGMLRVWSAGCATGQEPYTVAILLAEAMGLSTFRSCVKIYATDVDDAALAQARRATYEKKEVEQIPDPLRDRYFLSERDQYVVHSHIRRSVIFGHHDLVQDAPIPALDLLVCRNTLMYFDSATQGHMLSRFHFALRDTGFLFLGRAEMLIALSRLFRPVEARQRVFSKVPGNLLERPGSQAAPLVSPQGAQHGIRLRLTEAALYLAPVAQVVLDVKGCVRVINGEARSIFGLGAGDLGKPLQDLELSYRPLELRSLVDVARKEQRPVLRKGIERKRPSEESQYVDLVITPLSHAGKSLGMSITFADVTHHHRLQEELQSANENMQTAYEELQASNEELETINEELQASNEELEATNEELQSANEELETMNEELHSTNEELQASNEQLRHRTTELDQANSFLASILASLKTAVVVVDRECLVLVWNDRAEELWGLRLDEVVGKAFLELDIGLPVRELAAPMQACLAGADDGREVILKAVNRRGRSLACRVLISPLRTKTTEHRGVILLMEERNRARMGQDPGP